MSRRAALAALAAACVVGGGVVSPAVADAAALPTGATATSTGIVVTPGTGITAGLNLTGAVGTLLGPLVNPILTAATSSIVGALLGTQSTPGLVQNLVSALTSISGTSASTPNAQVANPAPNYPSCTATGWTSSTCYALTALATTGAFAPLVNVSIPTVQGYTNADPSAANNQPMTAKARLADPIVSLLGIPIGDLGVIESSVSCPTSNSSQSASAAVLGTGSSLSNVSLLGGLIGLSVSSSTGLLMVKVGTATPIAVSTVATQLLSYAGLDVSVAPAGNNGLKLTLRLGLADLLNGLGLSAISGLTGVSGNTLALTVTVAPGGTSVSSNSSSATAAGLEVKVGLSGSLGVTVAGLVGAALTVAPATGSADTDLLDLQMGRTSCTGGLATSGNVWYPQGLI